MANIAFKGSQYFFNTTTLEVTIFF